MTYSSNYNFSEMSITTINIINADRKYYTFKSMRAKKTVRCSHLCRYLPSMQLQVLSKLGQTTYEKCLKTSLMNVPELMCRNTKTDRWISILDSESQTNDSNLCRNTKKNIIKHPIDVILFG